uniref:PBC domain-containing protein n=1 Tax=Meloidogyne hapla TaxID=6305 RepID=A0A1I8B5Q8_MELHA
MSQPTCSEADLNNLLDKLKEQTKTAIIAYMKPDGEGYALKLTCEITNNPFYMPFCLVLAEKKQINDSNRPLPSPQAYLLQQELQLDNMLIQENIINGNPSSEYDQLYAAKLTNKEKKQLSQADEEYLQDKQQLSDQFHKTIMQIEGRAVEMTPMIQGVLQKHRMIRPVAPYDVQAMIWNFNTKFTKLRIEMKMQTCHAAAALREKLANNPRKRRNFSKEVVQILNDYYLEHILDPYPSDDVKCELARKTGK